MFRATIVKGFDSDNFVTEQVFYPSKDGTSVPMFIVHRKVRSICCAVILFCFVGVSSYGTLCYVCGVTRRRELPVCCLYGYGFLSCNCVKWSYEKARLALECQWTNVLHVKLASKVLHKIHVYNYKCILCRTIDDNLWSRDHFRQCDLKLYIQYMQRTVTCCTSRIKVALWRHVMCDMA